ncbi:hypothetical protein GGX14DRAFT_382083 [Mycena pura]|uniref:Uncharacterized protein n=1 Tax=Mycena pura TaxID=153505 RepID=A0AAD6Y1U6_9AGAR|nr:hypothetical protein GGX14DRAFT_382083 [Mycena pura]
MATVPFPWPSPQIIDALVSKSSGYFIYASTVIKFIDDKNFRPSNRLEIIVGIKEPDFGSPFAGLDQLYTQILYQIHDRPRLFRILTAQFRLRLSSVTHIEQFLEMEPGDVGLVLRALHSVIDLHDCQWIGFHHASFPDYLQDFTRAGEFYVGTDQHLTDLCRHILKAFSYKREELSLNQRSHVAW